MKRNKVCRIEDFYEIGLEVGKGRFGKVRVLTRKSDGKTFAGKFQNKRRVAKNIDNEIEVHLLCSQHPRFPRLHDVLETTSEIVLIMDYASGGEIYPYCVGTDPNNPDDLDSEGVVFSESDVIRYMKQILEGIQFLHQHHIVHLDVKPQNILLSAPYPQGDIILVDFGLSRQLEDSREQRVFAGTPDYLAPELVSFDPVSPATDVWSIGVVCYMMLSGQSPFAGDTPQETSNNICSVNYSYPADLFDAVSKNAQDFLNSIFIRASKKRASIDDLLEHPWLKSSPIELDAISVGDSKSPRRSISSPGGVSWSEKLPGDTHSSDDNLSSPCSERSGASTPLPPFPVSSSDGSICNARNIPDEHSNSSDSAICISDDDVTPKASTTTLIQTPPPKFTSSPCSTKKVRPLTVPQKFRDPSTPSRLTDFKRLSLKRKSKPN